MTGVKPYLKTIFIISVFIFFNVSSESTAEASVSYTYDGVGRIATALYDNGTCVVYVYDANGNRTQESITSSGAPGTAVWGTGVLGCLKWSS